MSESPKSEAAWTKLFHPRGPLVTLPLLDVTPAGALAAVSAYLDAGWLVTAPGLEEGEEKESIGWVCKSFIEQDGEVTPFVLLYPADPSLKFAVLKVYLDTDEQIRAFEQASHLKLGNLPEYIADNKPERGSGKTDRFIVQAPRPFGVVLKKNPKHNPAETDIRKKKPARLFVRWADAPAPAAERVPGPIVGGVERLNAAESTALYALMRAVSVLEEPFCAYYKVPNPQELPAAQYADAMAKLEAKKAGAPK